MQEYLSASLIGTKLASDQSRGPADTLPPCCLMRFSLSSRLFFRFGTIAGRSVRVTLACQTQAALIPTRPVPAPSSRTRTSLFGRCCRHACKRFDMSSEEVQVFRPKLSPVRDGSCKVTVRLSETAKERVIAGIAVRPDLSLSRALAILHICSLASSSSSQAREEATMLVR